VLWLFGARRSQQLNSTCFVYREGHRMGSAMQREIVQRAFHGPADPEVTAITHGKGAWPVSEPMAQYLFRLILALRPRSVLKFGAGWSSAVIGRALSRVDQGGRLTSLDSTDRFCGTPWKEVRRLPNVDPVLSISDLRLRVGLEGLSYTYAAIAQVAARRGPFDFLFIDAPPGVYGRYGTVFSVKRHLVPGAVIVLDDAARSDEIAAVKKWARLLGGLECQVHDTAFSRGWPPARSIGRRFSTPRVRAGLIPQRQPIAKQEEIGSSRANESRTGAGPDHGQKAGSPAGEARLR